jgi:nucleoside-diphosphate-sugar epimerase
VKILVTGGCGYKGSVLVPRLLTEGHDVTVVDVMWFGNFLAVHPRLKIIRADVRQIDESWFVGVDAIIHLASVANDPCSELDPKLSWETSALATMQLVEMAIAQGVKQFIYASSGSVYGVSDEPEVTENTSLKPISDYNKAKMVAERILLSYANQIAIQIIRPATVCGYSPRMRLDVSVNMLTMQALTKGVITVFGGDQTRPNIHIEDIVDIYLFFLAHPELVGIFNAGFENISIRNIAELVSQHVKTDIQATASNDPRSYRLSSEKLLKAGFIPKKNVETAIRELIANYQVGLLADNDACYNIRVMKKQKQG